MECNLTKSEKDDIYRAFETHDSYSSGYLDSKQLKSALRSLGYEPRADEITKLSKKYSKKSSKDVKISRDDFLAIVSFKVSQNAPSGKVPDEISKVFKLFDVDDTGKIKLDNLRAISAELGEKISDGELQEMIEEADTDNDNQINLDEFFKIMKKTGLY